MIKRKLSRRPASAPHSRGHLALHVDPGANIVTEPTLIAEINLPIPRAQATKALLSRRPPAEVLEGMSGLAAELLRRVQVESDLALLADGESGPFMTIGASLPLDLEVEIEGEEELAEPIDGDPPRGDMPYHAYDRIVVPTGVMQNGHPAFFSCADGPIFCHLVIELLSEPAFDDAGPDGPYLHEDTALTVHIDVLVSPNAVLTLKEWNAAV